LWLDTGSGNVTQITFVDLVEEYVELVAMKASLWDLGNQAIHPSLLKDLFGQIRNLSPPQTTLAVDLTANQLQMATSADFEVVLKVLKDMNHLWVRFGFEINLEALDAALQTQEAESLLTTRLFVDSPWIDKGVFSDIVFFSMGFIEDAWEGNT
jgi:hypothetical protein